jgi:hypothetical protein
MRLPPIQKKSVRRLGIPSHLHRKCVLGLSSYSTQINPNSYNHDANQSRAQAPPIPQVLEHLIQLNVDFQVLVCLGAECRCAVSPRAIVRHFNDQHQIPIKLRTAKTRNATPLNLKTSNATPFDLKTWNATHTL